MCGGGGILEETRYPGRRGVLSVVDEGAECVFDGC